jgi:hypothetical protein
MIPSLWLRELARLLVVAQRAMPAHDAPQPVVPGSEARTARMPRRGKGRAAGTQRAMDQRL